MNAEIKSTLKAFAFVFVFMTFSYVVTAVVFFNSKNTGSNTKQDSTYHWVPPDINSLSDTKEHELIRYGRELILHTSLYLGPKGKIARITNGMNCGNCHLEAGTKYFGNNYSAVASMYPLFRNRSGSVETVYKRINDCIERSLNGKALDTTSKEIQSIRSYILWLGKDVPKKQRPEGAGLSKLTYMTRAADTLNGKIVYANNCSSCHRPNGAGVLNAEKNEYIYPPLWGTQSFNTAAGLYRISNMAAFIKSNMPLGTVHSNPKLSDEAAWDVAAFIISKPRPHKLFKQDWPKIETKPVDHAFPPFADSFPAAQHKYGPFTMMRQKN